MPVKDYYKILDIPPQATLRDIKKSFRRLAMRYHPDTNAGNKHAAAWFREVQEAYDVLTDPVKKDEYLQARWLWQSTGKPFASAEPLTPERIAQQARELAIHARQMDHFRMDPAELQGFVLNTLDDEKQDVLRHFALANVNRQVVMNLLLACEPLSFAFLPPVLQRLQKAAAGETDLLTKIAQFTRRKKREQWWQRHQGWIMALATLVLCALIYFMGR